MEGYFSSRAGMPATRDTGAPNMPAARARVHVAMLSLSECQVLAGSLHDQGVHLPRRCHPPPLQAGLRLGIERWPYRIRSSARTFLLRLEARGSSHAAQLVSAARCALPETPAQPCDGALCTVARAEAAPRL